MIQNKGKTRMKSWSKMTYQHSEEKEGGKCPGVLEQLSLTPSSSEYINYYTQNSQQSLQ